MIKKRSAWISILILFFVITGFSQPERNMDLIILYDDDHGSLINTRPDNGWWPVNPGYPDDPEVGDGICRTTTSLLGTYESQDTAVILQHAYWVKALGCNVFCSDLTNVESPGVPDAAAHMIPFYTGVIKAYEILLRELAEIEEFETPTAYPALRLYGTKIENFKMMLEEMDTLFQRYPEKWYNLSDGTADKDKPFIEVFIDPGYYSNWAINGIPPEMQGDPFNKFNIRWTNGFFLQMIPGAMQYVDSLNAYKLPGSLPYWFFVENMQTSNGYYKAVYKETPDGLGVEQMITWASVWTGGNNWDGMRDLVDGKTPFVRYTEPVFDLKPKTLLVNRFNYPLAWPSEPQEGLSRNKSTHIEPNVDWGFEVFNEVAEVLYDLKGATKAAPPVPALASYDADRNSLKIALDGFPLEYRISNDETLDGAQWEFLDLREGGIKPGSGINRSEPIYIQTRNSFGESTAGSIAIPSGDLWSISFQVSDGDGALEGVTVQCDGRSVNTGTDGAAAIDDVLAGGSIAYTITKDGYKTVTGTMDLFKDEMVEITLTASGITPGDLWEMVDDVNESVTYSGIWATGAWDGYHRNTCHYTSEKDAKASFTFTGTGIKLIGAVNTNLGMAEVYIDGLLIDTIDFYRDTMALQVVLFADSTLSAGEHTIAIVATNTQRPEATGSFVFIDAFAVKEGPDHVSSRTDESFVKLFPNPSAGSFWISNIQGSAEIRIYSISGKLMHRERTESGQTSHAMEIGVGDLGAGVYLVRVDGENQHETIKLIIENYE